MIDSAAAFSSQLNYVISTSSSLQALRLEFVLQEGGNAGTLSTIMALSKDQSTENNTISLAWKRYLSKAILIKSMHWPIKKYILTCRRIWYADWRLTILSRSYFQG